MKNSFLKVYESDASRIKGNALKIIHPKSINDVCDSVLNNDNIVIRGGGTGFSGGAVPLDDVVLDLSKLIKISNFNEKQKTIEVEAGVVLDDLQYYLEDSGLRFPVNPSSHAVATIGGMVATNAVGSQGFRYGKTSEWVKWVEVVTFDGKIKKKGVTELSDYVGMEGITGVIVRVCLKLSPIINKNTSIISVDSIEKIIQITQRLKQESNIFSLDFLDRTISEGIGLGRSYHLIVECIGEFTAWEAYSPQGDINILSDVYSFLLDRGYFRIEDPKIMATKFPQLISWLREREIPVFGNIGMGIFHPCFNREQEHLIPEMIKLIQRLGGQISGKYGIGLLKREFVDINDQKILKNIKKRTDPVGKFNKGKVI